MRIKADTSLSQISNQLMGGVDRDINRLLSDARKSQMANAFGNNQVAVAPLHDKRAKLHM